MGSERECECFRDWVHDANGYHFACGCLCHRARPTFSGPSTPPAPCPSCERLREEIRLRDDEVIRDLMAQRVELHRYLDAAKGEARQLRRENDALRDALRAPVAEVRGWGVEGHCREVVMCGVHTGIVHEEAEAFALAAAINAAAAARAEGV